MKTRNHVRRFHAAPWGHSGVGTQILPFFISLCVIFPVQRSAVAAERADAPTIKQASRQSNNDLERIRRALLSGPPSDVRQSLVPSGGAAATPRNPRTIHSVLPRVAATTPFSKPARARITDGARTQSGNGYAGGPRSSAGCALGVGAIVGGVVWVSAVAGNASMYKDGLPGWNSPLNSKGAANVIGGTFTAIAGGLLAIHSCASRTTGAGPARQTPSAPDTAADSPQYQAASQAIDAMRQETPGTIPSIAPAGSCVGGSRSTIELENGTQYALQLFLAGPASQTPTIAAGQRITLHLSAGHYDVGARVSATAVKPYVGTWDIVGGCPYGYRFYIE